MTKHLVKLSILLVAVCLTGVLPLSAAAKSMPAVDAALYATDPVPLKPAECGQCHTSQFGDLKQAGGKHRFACQECHEVFHAYNPLKNNYAAIMPKCSACHNQPHGPKQTKCLNCHANPHAPKNIPAVENLGTACQDCHVGPTQQLAQNPSAHTEQGCQSCHHEKHGYIPNCYECHDGHFEKQAVTTCSSCHEQVHNPLAITLPGDTDLMTCSGCHDTVYSKWSTTPSKHGKVTCGMCHEQHGQIPNCTDCHAEPHDRRQLELFPNCLTCHIDVHDLPVKRK